MIDMDSDMGMRFHLIKRNGIKFVYESMVKAESAIASFRTDLDLRTGSKPLSPPVPNVEKADKIRKVLLAVMRYDFRYNNSMGIDYHYFFDPLSEITDLSLFDISSFSRIGRREMNERFLQTVEREDPDLVLSCIVKDELYPETIRYISENSSSITCNWFADDHWRFNHFGRCYAPHFNYCVTVDEVSLDKYRRLGYENVFMSQWAANPVIYHKLENSALDMEATFVGQNYSNRWELVPKLKKKGVGIQCFGDGWLNGWISFEKMVEVYNRSKINLNFSGSALGPTKQVKARVFDILSCGGFLLTEHAPGLERYYRKGKEIETFHDIDEAVEIIGYYLDDEEARAQIAEAGYQRTMKEHTYQHRFRRLFSDILSESHASSLEKT
jgi:spore maturation protein CgeB